MALNIVSYPTNYGLTLTNAYAWIAGLYLDLASNTGRVVLNVHPNADSWSSTPIGQISVVTGQEVVPPVRDEQGNITTPAVNFPTLSALMSDPDFANAYNVIGGKIYEALAANLPSLEGATQV